MLASIPVTMVPTINKPYLLQTDLFSSNNSLVEKGSCKTKFPGKLLNNNLVRQATTATKERLHISFIPYKKDDKKGKESYLVFLLKQHSSTYRHTCSGARRPSQPRPQGTQWPNQ